MHKEPDEKLDLDFRESQPAITQAMRKRVAKAWAHDEMARDFPEEKFLSEWDFDEQENA
jgi:hypothetical protein